MKRIAIFILILSILLIPLGCNGANYTYKIFDAATHLPISGIILSNGKKMEIKNGILTCNSNKITISKNGYQKTTVTSDDTVVNLEPDAFLEVITNKIPDAIYVDKVKYPLFFKKNSIIISPLTTTTHRIKFTGKFIKETELHINITRGKNTTTVNLPINTANALSFLKEIKFPEELKNAKVVIDIKGTIDGENIRYTLNATVQNGKVTDIYDKNIHYGFNGDTPFLVGNGGTHAPVNDSETKSALIYARNVLLNTFKLRAFIKPLDLTNISNQEASFSKTRTFENRHFNENITIYFNDNIVNGTEINIISPIENTNLTLTIKIG